MEECCVVFATNSTYVVNSCNKTGVWANEPCKQLRKDKVVQHAPSEMHATAVERERLAVASTSDGGIRQAFQTSFLTDESYIRKYADSLLVGQRRSCAFYKI